jgi:nucleotide-binding universal stress UspA family protein
MARVPLGDDETKRLEKEDAEAAQDLPQIERALVYADDSPNGRLAARVAGLFAARQQVLMTVLEGESSELHWRVESAARTYLAEAAKEPVAPGSSAPSLKTVEQLVHAKTLPKDSGPEQEVVKGYNLAIVGIEQPFGDTAQRFEERLQKLITAFDGPVAILANGTGAPGPTDAPFDILIPTTGRQDARLATEFALALAQASKGELTALHVFDPADDTDLLRGRARRHGMSLLVDVRRLGRMSGVTVKALTATSEKPEMEIRRAVRGGRVNLVVLGTSFRQSGGKYIGPRSAALVRDIGTPVLLIAR